MRRPIGSAALLAVASTLAVAAAEEYFRPDGPTALETALAQPAAEQLPPELGEIERRLNALQDTVNAMQRSPGWMALQEGRLRSTDVPRVEDQPRPPLFPKVKLTGFFQADAGFFDQSSASRATFGDIQDVAGFRRTRLAAVGDVGENVSYMLEMDFAFPGRPSFMDVWLDVHNLWLVGNLRVGQWRQPFGMDALTSVRELMFLERPLMQAFVPFRQIGVGLHDTNADKSMTWAVSGFRFPTDQFGGIGSPSQALPVAPPLEGDFGYGLAGRVTGLVFADSDESGRLLHIGADYCYLRPGTGLIQVRSQPEFGGNFVGTFGTATFNLGNLASVPFFVDTGPIPTLNVNLYDFEIGARLGSLYGQAEATYVVVQTPNGTETLPGAYVQVAYLLTGEERPYNSTAGVFGRIKPRNNFGASTGWGAWELAVRYSYIDMNNAFTNTLPTSGGQPAFGGLLSDITFGVNWYLNQFAKFQFNYIDARLNRQPIGFNETGIVALRAQLDF